MSDNGGGFIGPSFEEAEEERKAKAEEEEKEKELQREAQAELGRRRAAFNRPLAGGLSDIATKDTLG